MESDNYNVVHAFHGLSFDNLNGWRIDDNINQVTHNYSIIFKKFHPKEKG